MKTMTLLLAATVAAFGMVAAVRGIIYDTPCHATGGSLAFTTSHGAVTAVCNYPTGVLAPAPVEIGEVK